MSKAMSERPFMTNIPRVHWPLVMEAARDVFHTTNDFGVFAFGIGPRTSKGQRQARAVGLNVYVLRKHVRPERPVPVVEFQAGRRRMRLLPDVVATGRSPRASANGALSFSGLYAGAAIRVDSSPAGYGGVCCFLGPQGSNVPTHFLTAGHLFSPNSTGMTVSAAPDASSPSSVVGTLDVNLLDSSGIDVAAIRLTDAGVALLSGQDGPHPAHVLPLESSFGKPVTVFRPTTHDYSSPTTTVLGPLDALLEADPRGSYWVRGALGTNGTVTDEGDSGSILCTGNANEFVVGVCVGDYHAHTVCEPVSRAIEKLCASMGTLNLITI